MQKSNLLYLPQRGHSVKAGSYYFSIHEIDGILIQYLIDISKIRPIENLDDYQFEATELTSRGMRICWKAKTKQKVQ